MNLVESITQNDAVIKQIAQAAGVDEATARSAAGTLLPAIAGGIERNAQQPGGLDALLGAISSGRHEQYLDNPATLAQPETVADGNAILGRVLGSKDVSRNVAGMASSQSGISPAILKLMMPMLSAAAMAFISKQMRGGNAAAPSNQPTPSAGGATGAMDLLTRTLDSNKDGSALDDVLKLTKRFF